MTFFCVKLAISVSLREVRWWKAFENKVLGRIFCYERHEASEMMSNYMAISCVYTAADIARGDKSRMRQEKHVGGLWNAHRILIKEFRKIRSTTRQSCRYEDHIRVDPKYTVILTQYSYHVTNTILGKTLIERVTKYTTPTTSPAAIT